MRGVIRTTMLCVIWTGPYIELALFKKIILLRRCPGINPRNFAVIGAKTTYFRQLRVSETAFIKKSR